MQLTVKVTVEGGAEFTALDKPAGTTGVQTVDLTNGGTYSGKKSVEIGIYAVGKGKANAFNSVYLNTTAASPDENPKTGEQTALPAMLGAAALAAAALWGCTRRKKTSAIC